MSTDPVFSDIQKVNPSAIIELFTLTLDSTLHGATTVYRFHAGTNLNANGKIVWAGNDYLRFPVQATGFAYKKGQIPRPVLTVSNMGSLSISAILLTVNQTTPGNDLTGAKVVRIRTMAKFLDAANFSGATNPFGTPDNTAEFPQEIYYIDRKSAENREVVSWELAAVFDLAGIRSPKRQCTRSLFPSIGTFNQ
jgi:lambda family phage minor tail protein L